MTFTSYQGSEGRDFVPGIQNRREQIVEDDAREQIVEDDAREQIVEDNAREQSVEDIADLFVGDRNEESSV